MRTEREVRDKLAEYRTVLADLRRIRTAQNVEDAWVVGDSLWVALSSSNKVVEALEWILEEREGLLG